MEEEYERKTPRYPELGSEAKQLVWSTEIYAVEVGRGGFKATSTIRLTSNNLESREKLCDRQSDPSWQQLKEAASGSGLRGAARVGLQKQNRKRKTGWGRGTAEFPFKPYGDVAG